MLNVVDSFWGSRARVATPAVEVVVNDMNARIGVAGNLEWLPANTLNVDHDTYQRVPNKAHVSRIAREFDRDAFGVLTVSERRDGTRWILDGQHRILAVHKNGWSDLRVPCVVYRGLSLEEEARIFYRPQVTRRTLTPAERFRAKLVAGDSDALAIQECVRRYGLEVSPHGGNSGPEYINSVYALEQLWSKYKAGTLDTVLAIATEAWPDRTEPLTHNVLRGLGMFVSRAEGRYDRARLIRVLSGANVRKLEADSVSLKNLMGVHTEDGVGMTIHRLYNHKLQGRRLPDWADLKRSQRNNDATN